MWGPLALIIIFQPEIRRALEQLGGTNRFARFFGLEKDIITRTKEDIYKVVIAVYELAQKFLNSYVSKSKYNANKWNINSDRLEYKVFDDVFNTSKATNTAGAAKYTIKNTTAGGASAKELANSPTDEASSTYVK